MNTEIQKTFRFKLIPRANGLAELKARIHFEIRMTQSQFENQEVKLKYAKALELGYAKDDIVSIGADPIVSKSLIAKLIEKTQSAKDVMVIGYYPHSYHGQHYRDVEIDGSVYKYQHFDGGRIMKFYPPLV